MSSSEDIQWNGEGMPRPGSICEIAMRYKFWREGDKVEVVAHKEYQAVILILWNESMFEVDAVCAKHAQEIGLLRPSTLS